MAKPINETPILRGKEAEHFFARVREDKNKKFSDAGGQKFRSAEFPFVILKGMRKELLPFGAIAYCVKGWNCV